MGACHRYAPYLFLGPMSAGIQIDGVVKRYGAVTAVGGVTLDVPAGAFVSLLGPSGCGKTTLLRLVGGFETPDAGAISIGDRDVTRLAPQDRPTAMECCSRIRATCSKAAWLLSRKVTSVP